MGGETGQGKRLTFLKKKESRQKRKKKRRDATGTSSGKDAGQKAPKGWAGGKTGKGQFEGERKKSEASARFGGSVGTKKAEGEDGGDILPGH